MNSLWRGTTVQKARLASGLVLFAFAATHFLNHALGLVSLDAMDAMDAVRVAVIRSGPGTLVLGAALLLHAALALEKLVTRRTLRMPFPQAIQMALGFAIPVLLLPHVVNTRVAARMFGVQDTYTYELARIWPATIVQQSVLLLLVWVHGCMGLHYWLRLSARYRRALPVLFAGAVLLPFAAVSGVSVQGRAVEAALADPGRRAAMRSDTHWPDAAAQDVLATLRSNAVTGFVVLLAGAGAALGTRIVLRRRGRSTTVTYLGGPAVTVTPGDTLLDVSRRNRVAHLSVCGGQGRCSTCRVAILHGEANLDPPAALERDTLASVGAGPDVRLACQARVRGDVTIKPLLKSDPSIPFLAPSLGNGGAEEREFAVLFVDMRGFTAMTERKLAFDVVFILNQFFNTVGKPVYDFGGVITNYAGDGLIALFSDPRGIAGACRAALLATGAIDRAIADLNALLIRDMQQPMRIAMGLHAGPHIVGQIGYRSAVSQSVVGLAMNVASRMEVIAKQSGVQLAVSQTVTGLAGLDTAGLRVETVAVRGLAAPLGVVLVEAARTLEPRLLAPAGVPHAAE